MRGPFPGLALITVIAILIHGYHLGVDDAEIYLPAVEKAADPSLFPFGSEFFMSHAHMSLFPDIVGGSARLTHLPIDLVIFLWHAVGLFLLLLAAWRLATACFDETHARWGAVAILAGVLSVPVAGTALFIADPYVTARTLSTPATILAIACYLLHQPRRAFAWLLLTALAHPQMSVYGALFITFLSVARRLETSRRPAILLLAGLPFPLAFEPVRGPAREALLARTFFFVSRWAWYEWIGVFAPLALLWCFSARPPKGTTLAFRRVARTLVPFGLLFTAAALVLTFPASLENFTRLQPMRALHLLYVIFFVLLGGLVGQLALKTRPWRWLVLFVPLAGSMCLLAYESYPASPHLEWPGSHGGNSWTSAFYWIREHTPKNAVFALDPNYMAFADQHGFRAVAERSVLADALKDSGAVSLFPGLAAEWKAQVDAQTGWDNFRLPDFEKLVAQYPVSWVVTRNPAPAGLACPYTNRDLAVCRIPAAVSGL